MGPGTIRIFRGKEESPELEASTIFFLGEVFLVLICLNYAVRLSRHGSRLKNLAQETAILRARLEQLERRDQAAP